MSAVEPNEVDALPLDVAKQRIARIKVRGFRAFPGDEEYVFDLGPTGKNLLLYGENGSGKSSLFKAIRWLLSDNGSTQFEKHKNVFLPSEDGNIKLELTTGTPPEYSWGMSLEHPASTSDSSFLEVSHRSTFLDFKSLLRATYDHEQKEFIDLFNLVVQDLLRDFRLPTNQTVGEAWRHIEYLQTEAAGPVERRGTVFGDGRAIDDDGIEAEFALQESVQFETTTFFAMLTDLLSRDPDGIVARANHHLERMDPDLTVSFAIQEQTRNIRPLPTGDFERIRVLVLVLQCQYADFDIEHPAQFLNEARLTAVALSLYLAGAELCTPAAPGKTRLLVLDDVLIGLDMAHRIPVLRLLQDDFADWQVFLFTHDRTWYDLASSFTVDGGLWVHGELFDIATGTDTPSRPHYHQILPQVPNGRDHLTRAHQLLHTENDMAGAAVHIRAWFERLLKRKCEKFHRSLQYHENPKDYKTDKFWEALKADTRPVRGAATKMGVGIIAEVEMVRSNVLNKLSHDNAANLVRAEVQHALDLMPRLKAALDR